MEEGGYFLFAETSDAAANRGDEEMKFRMRLGKCDKCINIGRDGFHATLHGRNGIALTLQSFSLSPDGAELVVSKTSGTTGMHACQVAAENEYLMVGNSVIISGVNRVRREESGADFMDWGDLRCQNCCVISLL